MAALSTAVAPAPAAPPGGLGLEVGYDSTTPAAVPSSAPVIFPYLDGLYAWPKAELARFAAGTCRVAFITVEGNPAATVFDLEVGCCNAGEVARGIKTRRHLGLSSVVYCIQGRRSGTWLSAFEALTESLASIGAGGPPSLWWVAAPLNVGDPPLGVARPVALPVLAKRRLRAVAWQYAWGTDAEAYDLSVVDVARFPW